MGCEWCSVIGDDGVTGRIQQVNNVSVGVDGETTTEKRRKITERIETTKNEIAHKFVHEIHSGDGNSATTSN